MNKVKSLHRRHKWFAPLLIVLIASIIIIYLVGTKPVPPKQQTPEKEWLVATENILFKTSTPQINLLGRVTNPFDSVLSAGIVADVAKVPVRDGMLVKAGDILISLDDQEILLTVKQRQADIAELNAQIISENNRYAFDRKALKEEQQLLTIAENGVKRQATLKASKLVAQERYDAAESQRAQTALSVNARKLTLTDHPSRLAQLKARLTRAETLLNDTLLDAERSQVKAPFDGIITSVTVSPGERVQIGQALVSLYDNHNMELHAQIPDRYVSQIRAALASGRLIRAQSSRYGETHELTLKRLSGQIKVGSGGINGIFVPAETNLDFVLNNAIEITVNLPAIDNSITLPLSAIYGSDRIYRLEEGRLQAINIKILGKELDPLGKADRAIVESKLLNRGDIIATTQLPNAISGLKVKARD
ncbi:MAG: multidrug efflux pump subunit AcrA (membrane-fusion protein) [Oleiphilaceae bacterium]|jgi:multidrug efflux pump subunit AcrA (membrane-fusion protein)